MHPCMDPGNCPRAKSSCALCARFRQPPSTSPGFALGTMEKATNRCHSSGLRGSTMSMKIPCAHVDGSMPRSMNISPGCPLFKDMASGSGTYCTSTSSRAHHHCGCHPFHLRCQVTGPGLPAHFELRGAQAARCHHRPPPGPGPQTKRRALFYGLKILAQHRTTPAQVIVQLDKTPEVAWIPGLGTGPH